MARWAVACGTDLAARHTAEHMRAHHPNANAVDIAIAATFVTWVCEPGLTSLGSGGFCTVWNGQDNPVTIDGFVEMPGRSAPRERIGQAKRITIPYGGGVDTIIGPGSIGTPGALGALGAAWRRFGWGAWPGLVPPPIESAAQGVFFV